MLDQEFKYYLDHKNDLVKTYLGKHIVIRGEEVIGVYDNFQEAYYSSLKTMEIGTFLIQLCDKDDSSYTHTFHSRVSFA